MSAKRFGRSVHHQVERRVCELVNRRKLLQSVCRDYVTFGHLLARIQIHRVNEKDTEQNACSCALRPIGRGPRPQGGR